MELLASGQPTAPTTRPGRGAVGGFVATTGAALAAAGVLRTVDPHQSGHYPTCPFLAVTGVWCPGCGSLRALHDLLHLDLVGGLQRNPLAVAGVAALAVAWVCWGLRLAGRDAPHPTRIGPRWIWALLGLVLAFAVLRNVPGWTWLSPA
ncbi:DUF2752 domain-containing protein [Nocardioides sp.]|uniref:DUF2752 domain-containing protein n=1 Tax=Nocardioides sp. TaxID=35761 RepID=UPI002719EC5B|nr:DUF2752 domain-containing protein [Nocardioides sp.]MDO9455098.1 DUF2752 domain-containing protein [Nocardioides sp.]